MNILRQTHLDKFKILQGLGSTSIYDTLVNISKITGHPIYLVGGTSRDILMERFPKDIDVASAATPEEFAKAVEILTGSSPTFSKLKLYDIGHNLTPHPTGKAMGTMGLAGFPCCDLVVEHTTFREDVYYPTESRRPHVSFSKSLLHDLSRRDFTINAIAIDLETGEVVDPFNGRQDILTETLSCVGEPTDRFYEDYVRVLRAIEQSMRFSFTFDKSLTEALNSSQTIQSFQEHVAREAIVALIDKMALSGKTAKLCSFVTYLCQNSLVWDIDTPKVCITSFHADLDSMGGYFFFRSAEQFKLMLWGYLLHNFTFSPLLVSREIDKVIPNEYKKAQQDWLSFLELLTVFLVQDEQRRKCLDENLLTGAVRDRLRFFADNLRVLELESFQIFLEKRYSLDYTIKDLWFIKEPFVITGQDAVRKYPTKPTFRGHFLSYAHFSQLNRENQTLDEWEQNFRQVESLL